MHFIRNIKTNKKQYPLDAERHGDWTRYIKNHPETDSLIPGVKAHKGFILTCPGCGDMTEFPMRTIITSRVLYCPERGVYILLTEGNHFHIWKDKTIRKS